MSIIEKIMPAKKNKRVDGCIEGYCRGEKKHRPCADCGGLTDNRTMRIEAGSLRRHLAYVCFQHTMFPLPSVKREQDALRELRTTTDWARVSEAVESGAIIGNRMPEQYSGAARKAIRAFINAGFDVASVPNMDANTLNQSIQTLGLGNKAYAEIRGEETVLRRIAA